MGTRRKYLRYHRPAILAGLFCCALPLAGCAVAGPTTDTASPAATIKAQAVQLATLAGHITQQADAIDTATPAALAPQISPHTTAIRDDAGTLTGSIAPKLTAAGKDAGQVARERDQWHKAYSDEAARQKSALQRTARNFAIWLGLASLAAIGIGIWLFLPRPAIGVKIGTAGIVGLAIAAAIWKIAPWLPWLIYGSLVLIIGMGAWMVIREVGMDKLTSAWTRLVGTIEGLGEDAAKVKNAVGASLKTEGAKAVGEFNKLIAKAKAKL